MPPQIALLLCILFILFVYIIDFNLKSNVSHALWIPLLWMIIIGSKPVTAWLNLGDPIITPEGFIEGSPIDRNIFLLLILAGLFILLKRKLIWSKIIRKNVWIFLLFLYSGISVLWSDFPFVSLKRWIKTSGNLVMVLVVLTESDPIESIKTMFKRCIYVLIPFSILFIKYFLHIGRAYNPWTGVQEFRGVSTSKNMLGNLCLVCGLFLFWNLLIIWQKRKYFFDKKKFVIVFLFFFMVLWHFVRIDSLTSLLCLIIGACIIIGLGFPILKRNRKNIGIYLLIIFLIILILQVSFNLKSAIILSFGRDETLTGRTELWKDVINMGVNSLLGSGYSSFWLGNRLEKLWEKHWWHPNQAHNGFLETYLNLGLIGLFLLIGFIISAYKKISKTLFVNFDYGRLQMAFFIIILIYNFSEASFKDLHILWFILILIGTEVPHLIKISDPKIYNKG